MACESEAIALVSDSESLSFEALTKLSEYLVGKIPPRSLVFICAENNIPSVAFYVGCLNKGIVPLMVNPGISYDLLHNLVSHYEPEFVWGPSGFWKEGEVLLSDRDYQLTRISKKSPNMYEDLGLLLSTSGSTGSPKLVKLSYKNLISNAKSIAEYLAITSEDRAITTLPFSYTYGISIINSHLISGARIILNRDAMTTRSFWDRLNTEGATTFGGVPYSYQMLDRLHFERMNLPSVKYITQAGGKLGSTLHKKFAETCKKKGIGFVVMYGQTEATARMSYLPSDYSLEKVGSIGIAIPGGRFELIGEDGSEIIDAGIEGELVYYGPNVSLGYATCVDDLSLGDERNGMLRTGDIAYRDDDGYYYITGRKGRFVKLYGNRIGLDDIEGILLRQGIIAAALGDDNGITVFAETPNPNEVLTLLVEKTKLARSSFSVKTISSLPRNSSGKIQYSELENYE